MTLRKPSKAFYLASVVALITGIGAFIFGLMNADMMLNEKGYYFAVFLFGLFAAVSVQKTVRDQMEGIRTTRIYLILCWVALASAIALMVVGFVNANLLLSEKGFYGMAFVLSLFAAITVQKNVRDQAGEDSATSAAEQTTSALPVSHPDAALD